MISASRRWSALVVAVLSLAAGCARVGSRSIDAVSDAVYPGARWDSITNPRAVGWSPAGLDSVRRDLATLASTGFVAVMGGRILMSYGNTDELGYNATENIVPVHDLHATMLYLLGVDHKRLIYRFQGRDFRLTDVSGEVVKPILS